MQTIEITTVEEDATFTQERQSLHLRAYITPALASIGKVEWSLLSGEKLAQVSDDGVLQVKAGSLSGDVVVQAKAIDGSGVTATRTFYVPLEVGVEDVEATADGVLISAELGGVKLTGVTQPTEVLVTTTSGMIVHRSTVTADRRISLAPGMYVVRAGNSVRKVMIR